MGKVKAYLLPLGVFKIVEFLFLLIAWTTCMSAQQEDGGSYLDKYFSGSSVRPAYHMAMCILCWIFTIIWFTLGVAGIRFKAHDVVSSAVHFVLGVMLLVAGSLATDTLSDFSNDMFLVSCSFAIMGAIVIFIDAFVHVFLMLGDSEDAEGSSS